MTGFRNFIKLADIILQLPKYVVSHRKKFIYTKTMKTAGTSIEVYFEPWCRSDGKRLGTPGPE